MPQNAGSYGSGLALADRSGTISWFRCHLVALAASSLNGLWPIWSWCPVGTTVRVNSRLGTSGSAERDACIIEAHHWISGGLFLFAPVIISSPACAHVLRSGATFGFQGGYAELVDARVSVFCRWVNRLLVCRPVWFCRQLLVAQCRMAHGALVPGFYVGGIWAAAVSHWSRSAARAYFVLASVTLSY